MRNWQVSVQLDTVYPTPEWIRKYHWRLPEDVWSFGILLLELLAGEPVTNRNDYRNLGSLKEINEIVSDWEFLDLEVGTSER